MAQEMQLVEDDVRGAGTPRKESFATAIYKQYEIALPGSVPFILTGLRLGVGRALIGVVVGELYAATAGVGYMITLFGATFQTDKVFVGVIIICAWGMILMRLLQVVEERFEAWRPQRGVE